MTYLELLEKEKKRQKEIEAGASSKKKQKQFDETAATVDTRREGTKGYLDLLEEEKQRQKEIEAEASRKAAENRAKYDDIAPVEPKTKLSFGGYSDAKKLESLLSVYGSKDFKANSGYVSTESDRFWDKLSSKYGLGYNDLQYEYINNKNNIRDEISQRAMSWGSDSGKTTSSYEEKALDFMTADEVAVYNYYYNKEGKDKAQEFLDALAETLNARKAGKEFSGIQGKTAAEILFGVEAGHHQFEQGVKNLPKMITGKDDYIAQTSTQILTGMVREDLTDRGPTILGNSLGQVAFDTVTTASNMAPSILTSFVVSQFNPVAGQVVGNALMGGSAAGNAYQQVLNQGYDKDSARLYSTLIGTSEAALQYALGGIGKLGGTSATISRAVSGIENGLLRFALEFGGKIGSEAVEEGLQDVLDPLFKNAVLGTDESVDWENVAYSALLGGIMGAGFGASEVKTNHFTNNEAAVVKKETENRIAEAEAKGTKLTTKEKNTIHEQVEKDLESGYISTDTIESVLAEDSQKAYDSLLKESEEFNTLYETEGSKLSEKQKDRLAELKQKNTDNPYETALQAAKEKISQDAFAIAKGDRLAESYFERERKKQAFTADTSQYKNENARQTVQNVIDSGIANNTKKFHSFVDLMAKVSEEKGLVFNVTNAQKLQGTKYMVDGKAPNGFIEGNQITINLSSPKNIDFIAGHEITHSLEQAGLYKDLQKAVEQYARTKGEYDSRLSSLTARYEGKGDPSRELVADMIGDYVFTDADFVRNLSVNHRNVFQKIYDEIKYLWKVATAGSKEARELERVKKLFEEAYREGGKQSETKYSVGETTDGRFAAVVDNDILSNIDTNAWDNAKKTEAKKAASEALKQFSDGIVVDGITRKVNRVSRREYTRSEYTESLYNNAPDVFADKMRAAEVADDIVVVATDWQRDGGLKHPRTDNFVDFDHGKTLIASGDAKYIAEVVVGITDNGESVLYDVVDITPATFDIKTAEASTTATTHNAIGDIQEASAGANIPQKDSFVNRQFSINDSNNRQLSAEQQDYFKDSVVRDENGNLMVLYHGTQNNFTVFDIARSGENYEGGWSEYGEGIYLTPDKKMAEYYGENAGWGREVNLMEVYANIKNPFNTNDPVSFDISDLVKKYELTEFDERHIKKAGDRLVDFLKYHNESVRDYLTSKGYDGLWEKGLKGDVYQVVAYAENQIKNTDNAKPTEHADIRFSLSETVEESRNLMAIHNLHTNEVLKQLEMGGMPYPSVAVTNPEKIAHDDFGEVSIILNRDAIDPKKNKYNHIYSSDAYTPTFPHVSYEANREAADRVIRTVDGQFGKIPDYYQRNVRSLRDYTNLNDYLNRWGGEQGVVSVFADDYGMKQIYLAEKGDAVPVEIVRTETQMTDKQKALYQKVVDKIGADTLAQLNDRGYHSTLGQARIEWTKKHVDAIKDVYAEDWSSDGTMTKAEALEIADSEKLFYWYKQAVSALEYMENGGLTVEEKEDFNATNAKIDEKIAESDYKQWLNELFRGIEGQSGIRNSKDTFTPRGTRRSFSQLHDPVTIDNVIKAMRKKDQTGQGAFGTGNFGGASVQEYSSIAEAKHNSDMLGVIDETEYKAVKQRIDDRLLDIALRYANGKDIIDAKTAIVEAVAKNESKAGIARYLEQYDYVFKFSDDIADDIIELRNYVRSLPRPYFEAKPRRAVGFDEVAVFVIPNNADVKLKQELLNRGYNIAEYDPNVEGDRQRVVNQFEEYKFSLADAGNNRAHGEFSIPAREFLREQPTEAVAQKAQAEIAPVKTEAPTVAENATVSNMENVAPVVQPVQEELFPDSSVTMESLMEEQDGLRNALEAAADRGDYETMSSLTADYEAVTKQIQQMQASEDDRISSLSQTDAPPEVDAPYPGESGVSPAADPFADRDMSEVGNRSVKAYQYENPEVRPYFMDAALGMLGDLHNGVKGERWFNDDVYYESGGEKGFGGTKRQTTADIAELLDQWNYSYAEIEKGLNAIIEDNGKENNACSKRIEFMLHDRLVNGYTGVWGEPMPANQEYINFLEEKQINEYSQESFAKFMETADQYAPPAQEEAVPVKQDIAPTAPLPYDLKGAMKGQETNFTPEYNLNNRQAQQGVAAEDIAPLYDAAARKGVPEGQQAFMEDAGVPKTVTRKELHAGIIDNIKASFAQKGFNFDEVLKKAKNLSTFATVDNTPQRVMEKALGYKEGGILSDITVNKVAQNETEGIRWLNSFTDRKNGLLASISRRYNIKPGSKESAAAQMYAEGFYVNEQNEIISYGDKELAADFPDTAKQAQIKGLASDPRIRKIYDDTLKAINESRTRNAYPEIPRLDNYFLHFRAMEDTFSTLGLPFNPNDIRAKDLPTDLNGVTADLKPGQPYFASAQHRTGKRTSFDLLGGLERYLNSAKNQIYHIDDIQNLRALRNYIADTYGQANGLEGLDALSEEAQQERIEQVYGSHLSTFAKFLNEEANVIAGKTALIDRGLEGVIGRRGMTFLDTVNRQVGANMVGYNVSSSLTNFLAPVQAFAKSNKAAFIKGMAQFASNKVRSVFGSGDGFAEQSPVMIRRKGAERFHRTPWQKMSDPGYILMGAVDNVSTELIARAKYNELVGKGMDSQQAHIETDKWVSRLMGDRSLGQQPQLFNSKTLGIVTKFQLEVRNQLDSQFYDTIQETKVSNEYIQNALLRNAKTAAKVTSTFVQLAVAQHLFGKAFESIAGYNPAFDIISAIIKTFGWDDDEESEDTVLDNIEQGFFELMEDMPYYSVMTGGRIPIESALPVEELFKGKDSYGNEKSRWETLAEAAPYYFLPGGYGQLKKTTAGLKMFGDEHPVAGSYTDSGNLRFPVEDTLANRAQAAVFGQWASDNARYYFDNEISPLKEKQIQEYMDTGMPIRDYWDYREGLKGLDNLSEQADYINSLDVPIATKNTLINNLTDRKEPINLAGYDNFGSFEEFDFATKNPEKYEIAQAVGGYESYATFQDDMKNMKLEEKVDYVAGLNLTTEQKNILINGETDRKEPIDLTGYENFGNFEEFEYAKENPEKYAVAKSVGGYEAYKAYSGELYDIKADKDENGKSISGSRKEKVLDYVNGLDIDYGMKLILFKNEYNADDTYNYEIVQYLDSREDISWQDMKTILTKLGFTVHDDGRIVWD